VTHAFAKNIYALEEDYIDVCRKLASGEGVLDLSLWMPVLKDYLRPILPGELMILMANTSQAKTTVAQSISHALRDQEHLFFELELPASLMFERYIAMHHHYECTYVEQVYMGGERVAGTGGLNKIHVCDQAGLSLTDIEDLIEEMEPEFAIIDYIGLIKGEGGNNYEQVTNVAQGLKELAKRQNIPILALSQVHRKKDGSEDDIYLHDGKSSGAIENSAGILVGQWLESNDRTRLHWKILKQTKGKVGGDVVFYFDAPKMLIQEVSPWNIGEVPK